MLNRTKLNKVIRLRSAGVHAKAIKMVMLTKMIQEVSKKFKCEKCRLKVSTTWIIQLSIQNSLQETSLTLLQQRK